MAKTAVPKKKKAKPKLSDKEQSERFIETARQIGVDESGDRFELVIKKIITPKAKLPHKSSD